MNITNLTPLQFAQYIYETNKCEEIPNGIIRKALMPKPDLYDIYENHILGYNQSKYINQSSSYMSNKIGIIHDEVCKQEYVATRYYSMHLEFPPLFSDNTNYRKVTDLDFCFSNKIRNILIEQAKCYSQMDVILKYHESPEDLLKLKSLGKKSYDIIRTWIEENKESMIG